MMSSACIFLNSRRVAASSFASLRRSSFKADNGVVLFLTLQLAFERVAPAPAAS